MKKKNAQENFSNEKLDKTLLSIPVYLNTKIVFDMLATIEDGFSDVKTIQTSRSSMKEDEAMADIGTNNIFSLLNVGLKGTHKKTHGDGQTVSEVKTHTTVSLFQRLKTQLENNNLIIRDFENMKVGDFVEIQGVFKPNPVIDYLTNVKELMVLSDLFSEDKGGKQSNKREKGMTGSLAATQIEGLISGLQGNGKRDVLCTTKSYNAVIPTDMNYFLNGNMNEVTDGHYKVLGKVISVYSDVGEISLLRNTMFSKFTKQQMNIFETMFNDENFKAFFGNVDISTSIKAPVMMMIPIAIYV